MSVRRRLFQLLLMAGALVGAQLASAGDAAKPAKRKWRLFAGLDYMSSGDAAGGARGAGRFEVANFKKAGYAEAGSDAKAKGALGIRVGAMRSLPYKGMSGGASLGFVDGPNVSDRVWAKDPVLGWEDCIYEQHTRMLRVMGEIRQSIRLAGTRGFLGGGVGFMKARTRHDGYISGTNAAYNHRVEHLTRDWSGLTWEISAGIVVPVGRRELTLGPRFSGFPNMQGDNLNNGGIRDLYFHSLGFYAGLSL